MEYIIDRKQYNSLKSAWIQKSTRSAQNHILYNILRSFDPKRGFTAIENPVKLNNGAKGWQSYEYALSCLRMNLREPIYTYDDPVRAAKRRLNYENSMKMLSGEFGVELTPDLIAKIREAMK